MKEVSLHHSDCFASPNYILSFATFPSFCLFSEKRLISVNLCDWCGITSFSKGDVQTLPAVVQACRTLASDRAQAGARLKERRN